MANKNDKKIILLEAEIKKKKAQLEGSKKFDPTVNCLLTLPWTGVTVNINVLDKVSLMYYLSQLEGLKKYRDENMPGEDIKFGIWSVETWIEDVRAKYTVLNRKMEEARLAALEKDLAELLSIDAKVDRRLSDIMSKI